AGRGGVSHGAARGIARWLERGDAGRGAARAARGDGHDQPPRKKPATPPTIVSSRPSEDVRSTTRRFWGSVVSSGVTGPSEAAGSTALSSGGSRSVPSSGGGASTNGVGSGVSAGVG